MGVKNVFNQELLPQGTKFTRALFKEIDFSVIEYNNWTDDADLNKLVAKLLHNYSLRASEILGSIKGKYSISILEMNFLPVY